MDGNSSSINFNMYVTLRECDVGEAFLSNG